MCLNLLQSKLSVEETMLLESENMYMKMRIKQLEFDLESEKIRSRHFEGISHIAMLELHKGNWSNSLERRDRLCKLVSDSHKELEKFVTVKSEMVNCVNNLDNLIRSLNTILHQ